MPFTSTVRACTPQAPAARAHLPVLFTLAAATVACSDPSPSPTADAKPDAAPVAVAQQALTVDAHEIEDWTAEPNWRRKNVIEGFGSYPAEGSGSPVLHADNCPDRCDLTLANPIDLTWAETATLTLRRYIDTTLDSNEYLSVRVTGDSGAVELERWYNDGDPGVWTSHTYDLGMALQRANFRVTLRAKMDSADEDVQVDDVQIHVQHVLGPHFDWTESGEGDWVRADRHSATGYPAGSTGSPVASLSDCDGTCELTSAVADLSNTAAGTLSFLAFVDDTIDADDYLRVELFDGTTWHTELVLDGSNGADDDQWKTLSIDLANGPSTGTNYLGGDLQVRFVGHATDVDEFIEIDDVQLATVCAPHVAPEPCDGMDNDCDGIVDEDGICDDGNTCTAGRCVDGACVFDPVPGLCTDDNLCTQNDHCAEGSCTYSSVNDCYDANHCTTDTCDPLTGCVYVNNNNACDDGNACTTGDVCNGGVCSGTASAGCGDADGCCPPGCDKATDFDCGCGDGVLDPGEECDDGNTELEYCGALASCAQCGPQCTWEQGDYCGDGVRDYGYEACDDGNLINGDGCQNDCTTCIASGPVDNTCDAIDEDCDGSFGEDFWSEPTTCGTGACAGSGRVDCIDGVPYDSCVAGEPAETVAGCDYLDADCDGDAIEGCGACTALTATTADHLAAGRVKRAHRCGPIYDHGGPETLTLSAPELQFQVDTSGLRAAHLRYWRAEGDFRPAQGDVFQVRYSLDGGSTWTDLGDANPSKKGGPRFYGLPTEPLVLLSFQLQTTRAEASVDLDRIVVDQGAAPDFEEDFATLDDWAFDESGVTMEDGAVRMSTNMSIEVDTQRYAEPELFFDMFLGSSVLDVDIKTTGGTWEQLARFSTPYGWSVQKLALPQDSSLGLRFQVDAGSDVRLDNVTVRDAETPSDAIYAHYAHWDDALWEETRGELSIYDDATFYRGGIDLDPLEEARIALDTRAPHGAVLSYDVSCGASTEDYSVRYSLDQGATWTIAESGCGTSGMQDVALPAHGDLVLSFDRSDRYDDEPVKFRDILVEPAPIPPGGRAPQSYSEDFESGFDGWTTGGTHGDTLATDASAANGGSYGLHFTGASTLTREITEVDLTGADELSVSYWRAPSSMESDDHFRVRYTLDGGASWTVLEDLYGNFAADTVSFEIPLSGSETTLGLEFDALLSSTTDHAYLDDVLVTVLQPLMPCTDYFAAGDYSLLGSDDSVQAVLGDVVVDDAEVTWAVVAAADLACDGLDEDCNGQVDDGCLDAFERDGALVLEAEEYDALTPGTTHRWVTRGDYAASGGEVAELEAIVGAPEPQEGDPVARLDYHVSFAAAGTYYLWTRGTKCEGCSGEFEFGLNGAVYGHADLDPVERNVYAWQAEAEDPDDSPTRLEVPAPGSYVFNVWQGPGWWDYNDEYVPDLAVLDRFVLTQDATYRPQAVPGCGDPLFVEVACEAVCTAEQRGACYNQCQHSVQCIDKIDLCNAGDLCSTGVTPCVEESVCDSLRNASATFDPIYASPSVRVPSHCLDCARCYEEVEDVACVGAGTPSCLDGHCGPGTSCISDLGCNPGLECRDGACVDPVCDDPCHPGFSCGTAEDRCGVCEACTPACGSNACGCDGCGGVCGDGTCDAGETGCASGADCADDARCFFGSCMPADCLTVDDDHPCDDPATAAACGIFCDALVEPSCDGRCGSFGGLECGEPDPGHACVDNFPVPNTDPAPPPIAGRPAPTVSTASVGAIPGSLAVSPVGSAGYRIPLALPPGRGDVTPQLALGYDSGRGNGRLGLGWALDGLQTITRCGRTVASDGYPEAMAYDPAGPYCLNGRRLVQVAEGSEPLTREFRFELDDQTVVVATTLTDGSQLDGVEDYVDLFDYEHPTYFQAFLPGGKILTFGGTPDSRIKALRAWEKGISYGEVDGLHRVPVTQSWALSRVEDRFGNYATVQYGGAGTEPNPNPPLFPEEYEPFTSPEGVAAAADLSFVQRATHPIAIAYSMHDGDVGGTPADLTRQGMVIFDYEARPDTFSGWHGGVNHQVNRRMSGIRIFGGGAMRHYDIAYDEAGPGGTSRVTSVEECFYPQVGSTEHDCMPATAFTYEDGTAELTSPEHYSVADGQQLVTLDFDGDGTTELLTYDDNQTQIWSRVSDPTLGTILQSVVTLPNFTIPGDAMVVDTNNDGRDDLLMEDEVFVADASGFQVHQLSPPPAGGYSYRADLNADGRPDRLHCTEQPAGTVWRYQLLVHSSSAAGVTYGPEAYLFPRTVGSDPFPTECPRAQEHSARAQTAVLARAIDLDSDGAQELVFPMEFGLWKRIDEDCQLAVANGLVDEEAECSTPIRERPRPGTVLGAARVLLAREGQTGAIIEFRTLDVPWYASPADLNGDGYLDFYATEAQWDGINNIRLDYDHVRTFYNRGYRRGRYFAEGAAFDLAAHVAAGQSVHGTMQLATPFDVDADGRQDLLLPLPMPPTSGGDFEARWVALRSTGNGFELQELPVPLPWWSDSLEVDCSEPYCTERAVLARWRREAPRFADVDGDGQIDLVKAHFDSPDADPPAGEAWAVLTRPGAAQSRLTSVTDGMGKRHIVSYGNATDPAVYDHGAGTCPFYQSCTHPRTGLVRQVEVGHLDGASFTPKSHTLYSYKKVRVDRTGRGGLGFEEVTATAIPGAPGLGVWGAPERRITTTTNAGLTNRVQLEGPEGPVYLYPRAGIPTSTIARVCDADPVDAPDCGSGDAITTTATTTVTERPTAHGTLLRYVSSSQSVRTETLGGQDTILSTSGTHQQVDDYGNPTTRWVCPSGCVPDGSDPLAPFRTDLPGGITTTTYRYAYQDEPNDFDAPGRRHLVSRRTEAFALTGAASPQTGDVEHTRVTRYDYDAATGALELMEIEPDATGADAISLNLTTTYQRDQFGNVTSEQVSGIPGVDASGAPLTLQTRTTSYVYDSEGHYPELITNAEGHQTRLHYDPRFGEVTRSVELNAGADAAVADTLRDGFGRVVATVDAEGVQTLVTYFDPSQATGIPAEYTSHPLGMSTAITDPAGADPQRTNLHLGTTVVDWYGREVLTSAPGFDGVERLSETTYDSLGRVYTAQRPHLPGAPADAITTTHGYDFAGRAAWQRVPVGDEDGAATATIERCYDGLFECTRGARGYTSCVERDGLGRVVRSFDPMGDNAALAYALANPPLPVTATPECDVALAAAASGATTSTAYEYGEVLEVVTDTAGNQTLTTPDRYGRVVHLADPDAGDTTTVFNAFGEPARTEDAVGNVVLFTYDQLGRTLQREDLEPSEPDTLTTWTYDVDYPGTVASSTSADGHQKTYSYDAIGRLTEASQRMAGDDPADAYVVRYGDHWRGRARVLDYPSASGQAFSIRHHLDDWGRLQKVTDAADESIVHWELQTVDAYDQADTVLLGSSVQVDYRHDHRGLVDRIQDIDAQGVMLRDVAVGYDVGGNVYTRYESVGGQANIEEFAHDHLDRMRAVDLNGAGDQDVTYFATGNIQSRPDRGDYRYLGSERPVAPDQNAGCSAANRAHGVTAVVRSADEHSSYCYDAAGRRIWSHDQNGALSTHEFVRYTPFDKPRVMWRGGAADGDPAAGQDVVSFEYDADQARVLKTKGSDSTVYVGGLFEHRKRGNGESTFVYFVGNGARTVAQVAIEETLNAQQQLELGDPVATYLHTDHLGSPTMTSVVDGAGGVVTTQMSYDPWGRRRDPVDWTTPMGTLDDGIAIGFTGHERDAEYELVNMGGREYDPVIGRFLSPDPFVQDPFYSQSLNRYAYVWNNPLTNVDPSGFFVSNHDLGEHLQGGYNAPESMYGGPVVGVMSSVDATFGVLADWNAMGHQILQPMWAVTSAKLAAMAYTMAVELSREMYADVAERMEAEANAGPLVATPGGDDPLRTPVPCTTKGYKCGGKREPTKAERLAIKHIDGPEGIRAKTLDTGREHVFRVYQKWKRGSPLEVGEVKPVGPFGGKAPAAPSGTRTILLVHAHPDHGDGSGEEFTRADVTGLGRVIAVVVTPTGRVITFNPQTKTMHQIRGTRPPDGLTRRRRTFAPPGGR